MATYHCKYPSVDTETQKSALNFRLLATDHEDSASECSDHSSIIIESFPDIFRLQRAAGHTLEYVQNWDDVDSFPQMWISEFKIKSIKAYFDDTLKAFQVEYVHISNPKQTITLPMKGHLKTTETYNFDMTLEENEYIIGLTGEVKEKTIGEKWWKKVCMCVC